MFGLVCIVYVGVLALFAWLGVWYMNLSVFVLLRCVVDVLCGCVVVAVCCTVLCCCVSWCVMVCLCGGVLRCVGCVLLCCVVVCCALQLCSVMRGVRVGCVGCVVMYLFCGVHDVVHACVCCSCCWWWCDVVLYCMCVLCS